MKENDKEQELTEVRKKWSIELFHNPCKIAIWSSQHCAKSPNFDVFKEMVDIKYQTEIYIALKITWRENFKQNGRYQ